MYFWRGSSGSVAFLNQSNISGTLFYIQIRQLYEYQACRHQTTVTAGKLLHKIKLPLTMPAITIDENLFIIVHLS